MTIHVCLSSDDKYARHLGVTIASILVNKAPEDELFFHILDGGISRENRSRLESLQNLASFKIEFLAVDTSLFQNFPLDTDGPAHVSLATYYRILLPEFLPHIEKIIYLDCDVICRSSLAPLYADDMQGFSLKGAIYIDAESQYSRLDINRYVCAGVLLFNLAQWRRQDLEARCLAFIREHADKILMHDQDVLNVICQESLGLLDRTWDAQVCGTRQARLSGFNELGRTANIIHFIGARKPWLPGCRAPYRKEYFRYLALTPWAEAVRSYRKACLRHFFFHTRISHGRKKWYVCGIRVFQSLCPPQKI